MGGSAFNATQVGSMQVAKHIAKRDKTKDIRDENLIKKLLNQYFSYFKKGRIHSYLLKENIQMKMSQYASFNRDLNKMVELLQQICKLDKSQIIYKSDSQIEEVFKIRDLLITCQAVFSAMIFCKETKFILGKDKNGLKHNIVACHPIPNRDNWSEKVWR